MQSEEGIRRGRKHGMGVSQTFPIGEASCACHTQGVVGSAADRNRMCGFLLAKTKCLRHSSRDGIGSLGRVIEASSADRRNVRESALNLVGHSQGCEEIFATFSRIFTRSKYRPEVVAWMAGLILCQVA